MFVVIQKIVKKKPDPYGAHKELLVDSYSYGFVGSESKTKYTYTFSKERFERPIKDAYKVSIHESYRENGKVKKKQWAIGTFGYYSLIKFSLEDCVYSHRLQEKLEEMGITEEKMWTMVYEKMAPIIEQVTKEFQTTEEYKTKQKHDQILEDYRKAKAEFEEKYGSDTYDHCYDVYGELRNSVELERLKEQYQAQQEYKQKGSYYNNSYSNYSSFYEDTKRMFDEHRKQYSSYFESASSNYTETERKLLKKFFRELTKKFHPDVTKDDGAAMTFLNKLKEEWGI